jgi:hypothetical protein
VKEEDEEEIVIIELDYERDNKKFTKCMEIKILGVFF